MNLKLIHSVIKSTFLIAFALIVVTAATGLSYQAHYCHNKLSGVALYPELGIQQITSCGCADSKSGNGSQPISNKHVLNKNSCCSYVSYFNKITIESPVKEYSSCVLLQTDVVLISGIIFNSDISDTEDKISISDSGPPALLAGRRLVLFLSQQRIPPVVNNG